MRIADRPLGEPVKATPLMKQRNLSNVPGLLPRSASPRLWQVGVMCPPGQADTGRQPGRERMEGHEGAL